MSDIAYLAIPVLIGLISGVTGWITVHRRKYPIYWTVFGLALTVSAGLFLAAEEAPGWDGITYLILMVGGSLPAAAALLLGGGVGLVTRPRLMLPS